MSPYKPTDFDLWGFLDRNSKLFVTLGIFGAFTLYLGSFKTEDFKQIIDPRIIDFGILSCLFLILVIGLSILVNAYKDIEIRQFPAYIIETGNYKRAGFVIPYIIFIGIISYTIISLYSNSNSDLFGISGIFSFFLGAIIALRYYATYIIRLQQNVIKKYSITAIAFLCYYGVDRSFNFLKPIVGDRLIPFQFLLVGFSGVFILTLYTCLQEDVPAVIKEKYPYIRDKIKNYLSSKKISNLIMNITNILKK
jgi:hypothetical protein